MKAPDPSTLQRPDIGGLVLDPAFVSEPIARAATMAISIRADKHGFLLLSSAEVPFFSTPEGRRWLRQVDPTNGVYQITQFGRKSLGLPPI